MKPALTPEEWGAAFDEGENRKTINRENVDMWRWSDGDAPEIGLRDRERMPYQTASVIEEAHAFAALCLHGQTFGFRHEDVRADGGITRKEKMGMRSYVLIDRDRWESLAARLSALLPPEDV